MAASVSAFEKRLKRHVIAPVRDFFVVTAPGLEALCFGELIQLPLSTKDAAVVPGGVEFRGRLYDCYLANLKLRLANRILMRCAFFKATNFHKLEKKLSQIPWELYLPHGCEIEINVSSHHSRLYHKGAVAECFARETTNRLSQYAPQTLPVIPESLKQQQIFVRIVEDQVTVSLDSSGELLHKRGIKSHRATAPVRETIAAAILRLAKYAVTEPLIDPMCGSGSFSLEAAMLVKNIPAGWFREFAFMGWPGFRPQRWQYLRRECETQLVHVSAPQIFSSDRDKSACAELIQTVEHYSLSDTIKIRCEDFFNLAPESITRQPGLVVLNPPYGVRMRTERTAEQLMTAICKKLREAYKGWKLALLVPNHRLLHKVPFPNMQQHVLFHGGRNVTLLVGSIH